MDTEYAQKAIIHAYHQGVEGLRNNYTLKDMPLWGQLVEIQKIRMHSQPLTERGIRVLIKDGKAVCEEIYDYQIYLETPLNEDIEDNPHRNFLLIPYMADYEVVKGAILGTSNIRVDGEESLKSFIENVNIFDNGNIRKISENCIQFNDWDTIFKGNTEKMFDSIKAYREENKIAVLKQLVFSSGTLLKTVLVNGDATASVTPWHIKGLRAVDPDFAEEVKKSRHTIRCHYGDLSLTDGIKILTSETRVRYPAIEFSWNTVENAEIIANYIQAHVNKIKEELVQYVFNQIHVGIKAPYKDMVASISKYGKDPTSPRLRPRIFLDTDESTFFHAACWEKSNAVHEDASLRIKLPFKIYSKSVAEWASRYIAASMIFTELPICLYYAGVCEEE